MHGGVKFYRGAAKVARAYVEADHSRADDYYLAEGSGLAQRFAATPDGVTAKGDPDAESYESWVAGIDVDTGTKKGRLRQDGNALRFVEVTVNGPKTWSLAAALHPDVSAALDAAQDRATGQIVAFLTQHATTRVGPRGRQVQVPVGQIEAAVIRHHTSRAGDPHRHLHVQINARVWADGKWRGLHSVGVRDMIEAINGIGHAAVATDPEFRAVLATHGLTLDAMSGEIDQLASYIGAFSARTSQIHRNIDRYEAEWRRDHPARNPVRSSGRFGTGAPGPTPARTRSPRSAALTWWRGGTKSCATSANATPEPVTVESVQAAWINRDGTADWAIAQLSAKRSAWNAADVRGRVEMLLADANLGAEPAARIELAQDITARAVARCTPLLSAEDVPEHVRALTSHEVLEVEADIVRRLAQRSQEPAKRLRATARGMVRIDPGQAAVVGTLAGTGQLVVVEGAAGAGKTTALRATRQLLEVQGHRLVVVTPTLKAAEVAAAETGAKGHSAAWLIHQHGWRWDGEGHWARNPDAQPSPVAQLRRGDLLLVDEAGMLDQDTARALLTIADETGARMALVGDRHQLPAVGRGGLLDHAVAWAHPTAVGTLETVHRFSDPNYAALSLKMRRGDNPASVFDELHRRGQIVVHPSDIERDAALAVAGASGDLVVADTREQVAALNAAIRNQRHDLPESDGVLVTARGEQIGFGDRVATRRNDADLGVANRQTWTVTSIGDDGSLTLRSKGRDRAIPAEYAARFVELAYATTIHGAQGETVDRAHVAIGETTGAAAAYVAMTRGRHGNTAHLVADNIDDARKQWVEVSGRDRADLGPAHAKRQALDAVDRYGSRKRRQPVQETRRPSPTGGVSLGL